MTCKHGKTVFSECRECEEAHKPSPSSAAGGEKIDPENPSAVPERYRPCMIQAAKARAAIAVNQPGEGHTTEEGVLQMLTDLLALARNDGCVAAGWAFEQLVKPPAPQEAANGGWMPIDTARKVSGNRVLVYVPSDYGTEIGYYDRGTWLGAHGHPIRPTHWMPLPMPPIPQEAGR